VNVRKPLFVFVNLLLLPVATQALIVYDANSNSNDYNISVPSSPTIDDPTTVLWNNVAQICNTDGTPNASGVYLGNGFILTANHVNGTRYFIGGTECAVDTSYGSNGTMQVTNSSSVGLDLKLVKIQSPPSPDGIQMMTGSQSALSSYSLYIGWGVGKGDPQITDPATLGWTWGNSTTATERWGRNVTLNSNYNFTDNPNTYLATLFNRTLFLSPAAYNNDVFSLSLGDSGGGLFEYVNSQWMLAGIGDAVSTDGSSYYDRAGLPDSSFFVSMPAHSQDVLNAIPEPSPFALALFTLLAALMIRRFAPAIGTLTRCFVSSGLSL